MRGRRRCVCVRVCLCVCVCVSLRMHQRLHARDCVPFEGRKLTSVMLIASPSAPPLPLHVLLRLHELSCARSSGWCALEGGPRVHFIPFLKPTCFLAPSHTVRRGNWRTSSGGTGGFITPGSLASECGIGCCSISRGRQTPQA
jgi:hypothetical protein